MATSFFQSNQQAESQKRMEAMLRQMLADNKNFFSWLEAQKQLQATQLSNLATEPKVVTQLQALPLQAILTLQV